MGEREVGLKADPPEKDPAADSDKGSLDTRRAWARLIQKVYEVNPLPCPRCGSGMKVVAVIDQEDAIFNLPAPFSEIPAWDLPDPPGPDHASQPHSDPGDLTDDRDDGPDPEAEDIAQATSSSRSTRSPLPLIARSGSMPEMSPAEIVPATADFIIMGAMKCGTTSLFHYLREHPDICTSRLKEPHYFNLPGHFRGKWDHGPEWYASLFEHPARLKGEASTGYTKFPIDPEVSNRIHAANPHVKLIYLMRNPADRACSHYLHSVIAGREARPAREALLKDEDNSYLDASRYQVQLGRYLRLFPRDQIFLETAETLRERPVDIVGKVLAFLGVRPFPDVMPLREDRNVTALRGIEFRPPDGQAPTPLQIQLLAAISRCLERGEGRPGAGKILAELGFSAADRATLESLFSGDLKEVEALLGRPIPEWASPGQEN